MLGWLMSELNKLSALKAKTADAGKYGDGGNLWLHKNSTANGKWIFYFKIGSRRREMGLGPFPAVSLKEARTEADNWRAVVRGGLDPIKERQREKRETERNLHLLKDIAADAFESRKAELKGDGKAGRWFSPLELHVLPRLGELPVADIDQIDIRDTLAPIWHEKADTCRKAMNRLAICMKHAAALGLDVDLMAVEKAKALLGKQRHVVKHVPALPWQEVPSFYASLDEGTTTHLALRLLILTAVRSHPLRFLHLDQIEGDIWTIPAEAMKGRKGATSDFRVPLSQEALAIIGEARPMARGGYLFPSTRKGVISDATMARLMERRKMEARPHGFRSSFRDWVAETTNTPHDVAETALGHVVGGAVERAYRRTDHIQQRRVLMENWACKVSQAHFEVTTLMPLNG
jgi:integrase